MARSIFTYIATYIGGSSMVSWNGERVLVKVSFIEKLRHGTLLQKRELLKAYLADVKELSKFEYCCP